MCLNDELSSSEVRKLLHSLFLHFIDFFRVLHTSVFFELVLSYLL